MQDGPDHGTRRSRRTRSPAGPTPPADRSTTDRQADDDPLFGPLPGGDVPDREAPEDRPRRRRRAPEPPDERSADLAPRPDRSAGEPRRGGRRRAAPGGETSGPGAPDREGRRRAPDAPAARRDPGPPPGRPRSAERTDALPSVTPRPDAATRRPDGRRSAEARPPEPQLSEPGAPRRRRSRVDARATEVISAIMPRRRAKQAPDPGPDTPEDVQDPATAAVAVTPDPAESPAAAEPTPAETDPAPPTEPGEDERPPRRGATGLRITAAALAALVLVGTAAGFSGRNTVDGGIVDVAALDPASDAISQRAAQAGDENVLVLGLAADRLREPEAARTDTAVLVHMPAGGGPAVTLSMPATLEVSRPPCQRWDPATARYAESVPAESRTTLSSVYDVGGPACAVGAVQQLTGLALTRFVALDLAGADTLVTAVRGVTVCTERPVVDRALGPVVLSAGDTTLVGDQAARFAGAAAVVDDTSPANRVQRQQRVLAAALGQALSTPSLLTPGAPTRVSQALSRSVLTDDADAAEVLTLARSLSRAGTAGDGSTPAFLPVPVNEQPNTRGHMELRRSDAEDLFSAMRKHEPLPEEVTAPAQRAAARALPQGVSIDVLNAAGKAGLAGQVADSLRAQGFRVGDVSDAPESPQTMVRFSPDRADVATRLTSSLPGAVPAPDPAAASTLQLVLGSGFTGPVTVPAQQPVDDAVDCG